MVNIYVINAVMISFIQIVYILIKLFMSSCLLRPSRNQPETWTKDEMFRMQNHRARKLYRRADGALAISVQADV